MYYRVCKKYEFSAAHHIPGHIKCGWLHGHNYQVEIELSRSYLEDNMLLDFHTLDDIVDPIIAKLDHTNLDGALEVVATAENIAHYIYTSVLANMPSRMKLSRVRVWETSSSYAEVVA